MSNFQDFRIAIFPTVNVNTWKPQGEIQRSTVHKDGVWHFGIQAIILQKDSQNNIFTLTQTRSETVDLSQTKVDQSLATQMIVEDQCDPVKTLRRGLANELSVDLDKCRYVEILKDKKKVITKTYSSNLHAHNREIVYLFLVELGSDAKIIPNMFKIKKTEWVSWSSFVLSSKLHPSNYTKTLRLYTYYGKIVDEISHEICNFLNHSKGHPTSSNGDVFRSDETKFYHYVSMHHLGYDFILDSSLLSTGKFQCKVYKISLGSPESPKFQGKATLDRKDFFDPNDIEILTYLDNQHQSSSVPQ